jgi:hypothetical protein
MCFERPGDGVQQLGLGLGLRLGDEAAAAQS